MTPWTFSRRDLLRAGALGAGALLLPLARLGPGLASGTTSSPPVTPFKMRLPNPVAHGGVAVPTGYKTPVMTPGPNSVMKYADTYFLDARVSEAQVLPASDGFGTTPVWTYNGLNPGPTIIANRNEPLALTFSNSLTTAATGAQQLDISTHLHGAYADGFADGHPFNAIQPGASKRHTYFNDQPSALLWYHDHAIAHTARNVYHGLVGLYLLGDDNEKGLYLPANDLATEQYFDIPLVIQCKFFNADGSLNFPAGDHPELSPVLGTMGDVMLVNGVAWPYLDVQPRRYRFRIYNGSNARELLLGLSNGQSFTHIGTEAGLLPVAVAQSRLHIVPAERYDVIVDFSHAAGSTVVLQNLLEGGKQGQVMQFRVASSAQPIQDRSNPVVPGTTLMSRELSDRFKDLRALGSQFLASQSGGSNGRLPSGIAQVRHFRFERGNGGFQINKQFFDLDRNDAAPRTGDVEVWEFENDSGGWFHPVHLHLLHAGFGMLVLDRNGVPIAPGDAEWSWKDTVDAGRNNQSVRVIMKWPAVPVNPLNSKEQPGVGNRDYQFFENRYVFHCHVIDHEDHDMMAQIKVER